MNAVGGFLARPDIKALSSLIIVIALVIVIYYIIKHYRTQNTSLSTQISDQISAMAIYERRGNNRKAFAQLLNTTEPNTAPALLINYYVATAYNCAIAGQKQNGMVSTAFITACLRGGARCLDLAIYPQDPLDPRSQPVVCEADPVSRARITKNFITFDDACQTIIHDGLEKNKGGSAIGLVNASDPLFLMLRIRAGQNLPMLTSIVNSLQRFQTYRLPYTYYNCNNQDRICNFNASDFEGKVIIMSDSPMTGTPLAEYINIAFIPTDHLSILYSAHIGLIRI